MERPYLVVCDGFDEDLFKQLQDLPDFELYPKSSISRVELIQLFSERPVAGIVIRSKTQVDVDLIKRAKNLKYIIRAGEGTDNIDKKACKERDIRVANTPGANNNSAAEHAISLMFTLLRKTAESNQSMKLGKWEKSLFVGHEMTEKKVGIVGFGRVGQLVAKRLRGFDCQILFYDPFVKEESLSNKELGNIKKIADLEEIFSLSDIISVHLPLIDQTKKIINQSLFDKMPSHAFFVNAARGGVVCEESLIHVLKEKKIQGAGLDVFSSEPLLEDSPLRSLENTVLTPHLGASTKEAQGRVGSMVIAQLKEFFLNQKLINEVK